MDTAANPDEVRLRKGSPLRERLVRAGAGALVLLILVPGLLTWASGGPPLAAAFWAAPLGLFLIGVAALERNVAWIITRDGILIGEQLPLGQVHKRLIDNHDIADVRVRKNRFSYPASFSLACRLASGNVLISPPLPDITRVNETSASGCAIARPSRCPTRRQPPRCRERRDHPRLVGQPRFRPRDSNGRAGSGRPVQSAIPHRILDRRVGACARITPAAWLHRCLCALPLRPPARRRVLDHSEWRDPYRANCVERPTNCRHDPGKRRRGDRGRQARFREPDLQPSAFGYTPARPSEPDKA